MSYRRGIWLYVGGSIAIGAVTVGALNIYRRARAVRTEPWERSRSGEVHGAVEQELLPALTREELSPALAEAIAASARSHRITQPISEDLVQDLAARAEERRPIAGDRRHDVSSLLEPMALAPDSDADSISARPTQDQTPDEESYDALAPDDLGAEWLSRATEAAPLDSMDADLQAEANPPEILLEEGMAVVSEGSLNAASAEGIESAVMADLEEAEDVEYLDVHVDAPAGFEELALEKEARARRIHRRDT